MKKQTRLILALCLAACASISSAFADSSFALFQGAFGAGGAEETFKFKINYPAGALTTGQNLLDSIFGTPVLDGTDSASGRPLLFAGTPTQNVEYDQYSFGNQVVAFTFNSITIKANDHPASGPTQDWEYYVAGGAGGSGSDYNGAAYSTGSWTLSNDGEGTRTLANDSFDGWVFGSSGYDSDFTPDGSPMTIDGAGTSNAPKDEDFTGATILTVPEPGATALLVAGAGVLCLWKRKRA